MMTTTTGVLIFLGSVLGLIIGKTIYDYIAKNKFKRVINHNFSAFMMVIFYGILSSYIFNDVLLYSNWVAFVAFILALSIQWILFDILFNIANKDELMHVGKTSKLDKFLSKFKPINRLLIKLIPFAISLIILLILL